MENYVGKRLDGRYEIHEIIGVGGMSVVYKAYDNVDDRIVAVKILKEEFTHDEDFVRRFKNESKAIAVLSHPNIVKVYDVSFGDKLQYIVMEYVDGITLKEYIQKQGIITWNDAVFFISQILKALQHAHDKGIVHRDIKPQNIILLPTGNIKVTDFGIARFSRTETKTLTENAIGSVHYISPEQAKGEFTDERADIYSLGVVFYEMLAGRVPFEADSAVSVALKQINDEPRRITDINPDIPIGLEQICMHAMQKNPLERYQTATEMLLDLEEVIRNPNATFDYSYYIDKQPTKFVRRDDLYYNEEDNFDDDYDDDEDYDRKKNAGKVVLATILGLIVLVGAVFGLVKVLLGGVNTTFLHLDNFVGQSYDAVISEYGSNFNFTRVDQQTDEYAPGTIIKQSPEADEVVSLYSKVVLTVATTGEAVPVPNCYDLTEAKALEALEKSNFTNVNVVKVASDSVKEGYVVYTDPTATSPADRASVITVYVSSGPSTSTAEEYVVPDVVGLSRNDAETFLKKSGFTNIVFEVEDSMVPKDVVLSQSLRSGSLEKKDTAIKVVISSGQTTTTKPPQFTILLNVKLPTCIDENGKYITDYLIVTLKGVQYSKTQVKLDGSTTQLAIVADSGENVTVTVLLDDTPAQQNFTYNLNEDKSGNVDFSFASFNNVTASPAPDTDDDNGDE